MMKPEEYASKVEKSMESILKDLKSEIEADLKEGKRKEKPSLAEFMNMNLDRVDEMLDKLESELGIKVILPKK